MKVQTVYRAVALQGALHPHLRNFHRKEHTPRKILKQRTAGNLTIFPGIQIHGQIMLRRKKAQIFSGARDPLIRKVRISSDSRTVNVRRNRRSL